MGSRSAILSSNKGGSGSGRSTTVGHCGLVLAIAAGSASESLVTTQYGHT
ncbi:hypothetical protein QUB37_12475 [Microcoleus sp. AT3-A2]